jgi:Yip1-like protein
VSDTVATGPLTSEAPAPRGLPSRVVGVLTSPRATYGEVAARPRWPGVLLVVLLASTTASTAFLSTDVGHQALMDQQVRTFESFGRQVTDVQYRQFQRMAPYAALFGAAGQVLGVPLAILIVSGIAFAVFAGVLGGHATFTQTFAVVAHSFVVHGLWAVFSTPLNYAREAMSSPTDLAALLPQLDEGSFDARLLGSIDVFRIWWLISLAIGLGVLYRRRTAPIAAGLLIAYAAIALVVAAVGTAFSGA